jgi:hypothetical protein
MEAILQEVISNGSTIDKVFSLDPPFTYQKVVYRGLILAYEQETLECIVLNAANETIVFIYDMRYMDNPSYDIDCDKIILSEFLATRVKVSKECDDYSEMIL